MVALIGWTGPPTTLNIILKAAEGVAISRQWTDLRNISPYLVRAVIASEDTRFCQHDGFDLVELQNAIDAAKRGRRLRGASTISQQTAKNVFLYNGGGYARKALEAWFTVLIEIFWSKPRIMEVYLNVAEWGDGAYGAQAAGQKRFGVNAGDLSRNQSARLAAVLPSPNRWKVTGSYARRQAGRIEAKMRVVARDGLDDCVFAKPQG
jgi:monofunctional biosynthetic peptidoglycan transglycosylase